MKKRLFALSMSIVFSCLVTSTGFGFIKNNKTLSIDPSKAISVEGGKITGVLSADKQVAEYKGIPYAAPPVGALRWKAPQPVKPWNGVKSCNLFSASEVQTLPDFNMPWMACYTPEFFSSNPNNMSEDCLYLNVWTKANSDGMKKPVIVYIHGGGFGGGSADIPIYNGESIAKKDVVYVGINYRVGIFGFLTNSQLSAESKDGISGNYGILDQITALKWVKNNISKFGGDPDNVTISGQSAGAISVDYLTISPYAKGLFRNAVCMSGALLKDGNALTLKEKEAKDDLLFKGKSLKEMRALSSQDLMKVQTSTWPCIDGKVIPDYLYKVLKSGTQNKVNMITGYVSGDTSLFGLVTIGNPYAPPTTLSKADFEKAITEKFGDLAKECLDAYPVAGNDANAVLSQLYEDSLAAQQYYVGELRTQSMDKATYMYMFYHSLPGKADFGAFHTADTPYWLGTLGVFKERGAYLTKTDSELSDNMLSYLVHFARTGNPNGTNLKTWNVYNGSLTNFYFGDNTYGTEGMGYKKTRFWIDYLNSTFK